VTLKRGLGSLKVIGTDTDRSAAYNLLLTFHSNHGHVSYRFREKLQFQSKIAKFSHPVYFTPLLEEFPVELGTGAGVKKQEWWGYRDEKEVWRYLQQSRYNASTWQTDGQTDRHGATAKTALTHSVAR